MFKRVPKTILFILGLYIVGLLLVLNTQETISKNSAISLHIVLLMLSLFIWNVGFIRYFAINKKFDLILGYTYLGVFILAIVELLGYFLDKSHITNWGDMLQRLWLAFGLIVLLPRTKSGVKFFKQLFYNKTIWYLGAVALIAVIGGIIANTIKHDTHSEIIELLNFAILLVFMVAFSQVLQYKSISNEKMYSKILYSVILIVLAQTTYIISGDTNGLIYLFAEFLEICSFSILAFGLLINIVDAFKYQQRARLVLVNKNRQLALIDRQKDEFVGFVSHQLRTPLTAIKWRIDLIEEKPDLDNNLRKELESVQVSNQHLINLVKMFLSVTRLNLNRYEPQIEFFYLRQLVDSILKDNEPAIVIKNLHTKIECDENIKLEHDKTAISSILDNLITNAIKYCRQNGHIEIKCVVHNHQLILGVADDGIGIPKNQQASVFKPFVRLDNALKTSASGSGYGLYFIQRLTTALGGIISFESEENKGTAFEVGLPLKLASDKKDN